MKDKLRNHLRALMGRGPAVVQTAALCVRPEDGRVLLITSRDTGRWVLPKGWPMRCRTLAGAAAQEAWEEAGVIGTVEDTPCGHFGYLKRLRAGFAVPVLVEVYRLTVSGTAAAFPEAGQRTLGWFTPEEAAGRVAEIGLRKILMGIRESGHDPRFLEPAEDAPRP